MAVHDAQLLDPDARVEVFVIEFETDSVQLSLHDGVPEFNSTYAPYVPSLGAT